MVNYVHIYLSNCNAKSESRNRGAQCSVTVESGAPPRRRDNCSISIIKIPNSHILIIC